MPAPTGSEAQFGYKYATGTTSFGEDIWSGPVNKFLRFISMDGMNAQFTSTPIDNMDPSNQALSSTLTAGSVTPKLSFNPDVNSIIPLLVHHGGKDGTITTPAGGTDSRQWVIGPYEYGDTAPASHIDSLIMEHYDGQECGLVDGARLQDLTVKIEQGKNVVVGLDFLACGETQESDATQLAIGTYTGKPIIKGHRGAALAGLTLKVKVTAVAGSGNNGTVKWTVGSYAGSTTTAISFNTWYELVLDDGSLGGVDVNQNLWFLFPSTSPGTTLAVNDEWSFVDTRVPATPSYSTRSILTSGGIKFKVDGVEYFFKSGEIKLSRPRKTNPVVGRIFPLSVQKNGKWQVSVSLDRDRDDTVFMNKLRKGSSFTFTTLMRGLPIEGNILESWTIASTGKVTDVKRGVSNENTLQEKIEVMGERSGSTDIFTHTVVGSLTSL